MDTRSVIDPETLARYIITRYEEDDRKLSSRNINDILYIFQLCYIRRFNHLLFVDEFKAGIDGPELFKSYDRGFDRQLVKSVLNQLPTKSLLDDWIDSSKKRDSSDYHRISVGSLSPWSVRYQGDSPSTIRNDDLIRYARADEFDSIDGSYLDKSAGR